MKKVIILAIVLVYIASIVIVNFFGLEIKIFQEKVYAKDVIVESVMCPDISGTGKDYIVKTENLQLSEGDPGYDPTKGECRKLPGADKYSNFYYVPFTPKADGTEYGRSEEEVAQNPNKAVIRLKILPLDASQEVSFIFAEEDAEKAVFDSKTRTITFLKDEMISVCIKTTDGSEVATDWFYIRPRVGLHY